MTVHCSGEHLGRPCAGQPSIRCGACGAVRYCSPYHQRLHWPEHKHDCQRYQEQMRVGAVLHDFPFTFTHESTFLPLTLYHSLQLVAARSPSNGVLTPGTLRIHYLGPDRELDQLEVFAELGGLLRVEHIHLDFIGPSVPGLRDSKQLELKGFPECSDGECKCKSPSEKEKNKGYVSLRLWKGLYHEVYEQVTEDFPPDFIFAPNAGIAAFPSWVPTVELIDKLKIPAVFTDFCEEATILASNCVKEALACEITIPVQVNPFRQPITPPNKVLELPTYSNCFLFGIN